MKCWKCGQEVVGGSSVCPYCGAAQARPEPTTETGRAMRALYDRYGAQEVLTNSAYLVNGLADLTDVDKKLRNQLRMALDAGLGKVYLDQLSAGAPDGAFDNRVQIVLTEDAGLSDKAAETLAEYFDEMIGWRGVARSRPQQQAKSAEKRAPGENPRVRAEQTKQQREPAGTGAEKVPAAPPVGGKERKRWVAVVLWIFSYFGCLGFHWFYVGRKSEGAFHLIFSLFLIYWMSTSTYMSLLMFVSIVFVGKSFLVDVIRIGNYPRVFYINEPH